MDTRRRLLRKRSISSIRSGLILILSLALVLCFLSYNLLQGTVNVGRFLQSVLLDSAEDEEPILQVDSYLVWSPNCQIPNVDPFHESIRRFITPGTPIVCSKVPPLTYIDTPVPGIKNILRVNVSVLSSHYHLGPENVSCCYSEIKRINVPPWGTYNRSSDNFFKVDECRHFNQQAVLRRMQEFFAVRCYNSSNKEFYANVHAVVPLKPLKRTASPTKIVGDNLSILILGLDSISRLNMLRTMPKLVRHLRRSGWLELRGYNKVGENTLPNMAAFLTGMNLEQMGQTCWKGSSSKFDDCPFIWNQYSKLGHITAYIEDEPTGSTFNFHKTGFVKPPTDYYTRPFFLAAESILPLKTRDFLKICLGPTPVTEHVLHYIHDFAAVFGNNSIPFFLLTWINNFSHNSHTTPATLDVRFLKFFKDLNATGVLNKTVVVFLSDHGMRWGEIRKTSVGWLEERLPFVFIWVPAWFRKKNMLAFQNLRRNGNRLTSPYDLYMTFADILERNAGTVSKKSLKSQACPKCRSLFTEIPVDRTCTDAGVTDNWCTCTKYRSLSTKSEIVNSLANFAVDQINDRLEKNMSSCPLLLLDRVLNVKRKVQEEYGRSHSHDDFVVMFDTKPGGAVFEATVGRQAPDSFELKGSVSRINSYTNQSECVDDAELKLYCFCGDGT